MTKLTKFYDGYHQKNDQYHKLIGPNNFTYFYILDWLRIAGLSDWRKKKVLDVGCGVGTMSLDVASKGAAVTGVDVSPRALKIAQAAQKDLAISNVIFKQGELKKGTATFDVAVCFEVIEHVKNEAAFLANIRSHLKPKGILILSTPSSENVLYKSGFYYSFDRQVGHLRRYTTEKLKETIEEAGFKVVKIREVEGPLRNLLFTTRLGFLIRGIKGPLVPLFHVFDRVSGVLLGYTDIQVIARKA